VPIYRQMPKYRRLLRNERAIHFEPEKNIWLLSLIHTIMEGRLPLKLVRCEAKVSVCRQGVCLRPEHSRLRGWLGFITPTYHRAQGELEGDQDSLVAQTVTAPSQLRI
jgi:hypothetical protein